MTSFSSSKLATLMSFFDFLIFSISFFAKQTESIECGKDLYYLYVILGIIGALLTFFLVFFFKFLFLSIL